jgi:hypothetical protein
MTGSAITWRELVHHSQMTGDLPVVIPTGSAPLVGLFTPQGSHATEFVVACFSPLARHRCVAALAACAVTRDQYGVDE